MFVSRLIHNIHRGQLQGRPPQSIHEALMGRDAAGNHGHRTLVLHISKGLSVYHNFEALYAILNLRGTFWQDDPQMDFFICHSFAHLWPFQEGDLEDVAIAFSQFSEKAPKIGIPANSEAVLPATKDRIPWPKLEYRLARIAPIATCRNIANVIREVRIHTSDL